MKKMYEKTTLGDSSIEFLSPDYDGITKVLQAFDSIYDKCGDRNVIDKILEKILSVNYIGSTVSHIPTVTVMSTAEIINELNKQK